MKITIPMKLPSLNDYIDVCRQNRYEAAKFKRELEGQIGLFLGRMPRFKKPVTIHAHWVERDARRDPDNIASAKKFILDAMVKKGKLKDDSMRYVKGFEDTFEVGDGWRVILNIKEEEA